MMMRVLSVALVLILSSVVGAAQTQEKPPEPQRISASNITTLMLEVTIARYQGEKRLSTTPFSLACMPDPGSRSSLRMGGQIPIPATTFTPSAKEGERVGASYSYRDIGTSIDCTGAPAPNDRYRLTLTVDETSLYPADNAPPTTKTTGAPAFRSFRTTNTMVVRDGQSVEYTAATDRLTGEVVKVTVRLTVVK